MQPLPHSCERARTWASLRADAELSELESALLDAHLDGCVACRSFARGFEGVAGVLRATALERPAPLALPLAAARPPLRALQAVAVALVLVAAGLGALLSGAGGHRPPLKPVAMVAAVETPDGLRQLRRAELIDRRNKTAAVDV